MSTKQLNCVDLFAGAGGFSLAAINAGLNVVAAIEINRHACATYRRNIIKDGRTSLYEKNILDVDPHNILKDHFKNGQSCDIVLGGPPCQGFSVHRINNAGVGDPRNKLLLRYFEFVSALKPKAFLVENVPGLLWPRHKDFLDAFYENAQKVGYTLAQPTVVDARNYGIPQRRKRVFILGLRNDIKLTTNWPPPITHADPSCTKNLLLKPWVTAQTVFDTPPPVNDKNNIHMQHTDKLIDVFKNTPLNGGSRKDSGRTLPCHRDHNGHKDVYGRIDPAHPAPTMTTACINPSRGRFVHPIEHHGITLRQAARFQTFPDEFVFEGGLIAASEQIGNAVPVKLGEILLRSISSNLENRNEHD